MAGGWVSGRAMAWEWGEARRRVGFCVRRALMGVRWVGVVWNLGWCGVEFGMVCRWQDGARIVVICLRFLWSWCMWCMWWEDLRVGVRQMPKCLPRSRLGVPSPSSPMQLYFLYSRHTAPNPHSPFCPTLATYNATEYHFVGVLGLESACAGQPDLLHVHTGCRIHPFLASGKGLVRWPVRWRVRHRRRQGDGVQCEGRPNAGR